MKNQLRSRTVSLLAGDNTPFTQDDLKENISLDARAMRVCCGHAIEPYVAEMRDPSGPSLFVSVWRCPRCGGSWL